MTDLKLMELPENWRADAGNSELNLSDDHRDAMIECADELEAVLARAAGHRDVA